MQELLKDMLHHRSKRKIIGELLEGFKVTKVNKDEIIYTNAQNDKLILTRDGENLKFTTKKPHQITTSILNKDNTLNEEIIEIRENGIIVKKIEKRYINRLKKESPKSLSYLYVSSMVFTKEKIIELLKKYNLSATDSLEDQIHAIERHTFLEVEADFKSSIEIKDQDSHLTVAVDNYNIKDNKGYEQDFSTLYRLINGENRIKKIYELYNGQITKDNIDDLRLIHQGKLREEAFGLKEELGITEVEDTLVAPSTLTFTKEQLKYLKNYFKKHFKVTNVDFYSRKDIISALLEEKNLENKKSFYTLLYPKKN